MRGVCNAMKAIFGHPHAFVTRETLRTVFAEAVGILNSQPLCPSSDDASDREPITSFSSGKGCPCHWGPFKMRTYTPASSGEGANFS